MLSKYFFHLESLSFVALWTRVANRAGLAKGRRSGTRQWRASSSRAFERGQRSTIMYSGPFKAQRRQRHHPLTRTRALIGRTPAPTHHRLFTDSRVELVTQLTYTEPVVQLHAFGQRRVAQAVLYERWHVPGLMSLTCFAPFFFCFCFPAPTRGHTHTCFRV